MISVADVRAFNRYYTNVMSVVEQHVLKNNLSQAEARVLFELANYPISTQTDLIDRLSIDAGYLSRIIRRFEREGLISRSRSTQDARTNNLALTPLGQDLFQTLNQAYEQELAALTKHLSSQQFAALAGSMQTIQNLLTNQYETPSITIRHDLRPGDLGLVTRYHGLWYAPEFGYDMSFEGYVAETVCEFAENYSPKRDRLWIAEVDGQFVGCIAIVGRLASVGQLRWFLLDKSFRGQGVGKQLVDLALAFGREQNYKSLYLLTTTDQATAHYVYKRAGFELTDEHEPVQMWGQTIQEQRYELIL
jgi:DNA-binding MarR family transcriptional regulator/N-acetylglutamate synthase-like GNAT family acetyltransferase